MHKENNKLVVVVVGGGGGGQEREKQLKELRNKEDIFLYIT